MLGGNIKIIKLPNKTEIHLGDNIDFVFSIVNGHIKLNFPGLKPSIISPFWVITLNGQLHSIAFNENHAIIEVAGLNPFSSAEKTEFHEIIFV